MQIKKAEKVVHTQWRVYQWGGPSHRKWMAYYGQYPPSVWMRYRYGNLASGEISCRTGTYVLTEKPTLHYRWMGWNKQMNSKKEA